LIPFRLLLSALVLCGLVQGTIHARSTSVFEHLTADDGLSDNFIRCLLQDHQGFLWIGTGDGLNRFDGYEFAVFKPDPNVAGTLSHNTIHALFEDSRQRLWVATSVGLNRFHPETQTFSVFLHRPGDPDSLSDDVINAIAEDGSGRLWIGTNGGLNLLDPETGRVRRIDRAESGLASDVIRALAVAADGTLWVGTDRGLCRSSDRGRRFQTYRHDPEDPGSLGADLVTRLMIDDSGRFWIGTFGGGLCRYLPEEDRFRVWRNEPENPIDIHNNISDMTADASGTLWITTQIGITQSGLHRFDPETARFDRYHHDPANASSLTWNYATAVAVDRSGIIWAGTSRGLNKLDRTARKFNLIRQYPDDLYNINDNYYAIYEDEDGLLYLGLDLACMLILDREAGRVTPVVINPSDINDGGVYDILGDAQGRIWMGSTANGLVRYLPDAPNGARLRTWTHDPEDPDSIGGNYVGALLEDRDGLIWVGTLTGLALFDPETERFTAYRADPDNPRSLSDDRISTLYRDRAGTLWVGTGPSLKNNFTNGSNGLNRFDRDTDDFTVFAHDPRDPTSISDDEITCMLEDAAGRFWVGTNNGLNLMDRQTGRFRHYLDRDGLASAVIRGILDDTDGRLWVSTVNGLSRFDPDTGEVRKYGVNDGLQHLRFNKFSYWKSDSGELFFGGVRGLNIFRPEKVRDSDFVPPLVLTDFRVFDQALPLGEPGGLPQHVSTLERIRLDHDRNDIAVTFASLHFSRPEQNLYRFYLSPYEHEWRSPGHERRATYTNLDPGRYRLHVKASNSDGVWNDEVVTLAIHIRPPWWATWWASVGYVLLGLVLITLLVRLQMRRTAERIEREARKERAAAHLREVKLAKEAAEARARAIKADNLRKTEELQKARELQLSMLPTELPRLPGYQIAAISQPATEVGGDYYDCRIAPEGRFYLAVGDATGHGLHAGTLVAATKSLFNALADRESPRIFLQHASVALKTMGFTNMYMGMISLVAEGRSLTIASAGMPFPLLYRAATGDVETFEFRSLPLGALTNYAYGERRFAMAPGDVLLLMSDGLVEMFDPDSQLLGAASVRRRFSEIAHWDAAEIVADLETLGRDWASGRPPEDDVTLLVLRATDAPGETRL